MESLSPANRLKGNRLTAARLAWLVLLLVSAAKQCVGLPLYVEELTYVCSEPVETACVDGNALTETQAKALQESGISLRAYAISSTIWLGITVLIWTGMGIFIFLLRPDNLMAWIASSMMILFAAGGYETQIALTHPGLAGAANLSFSIGNLFLFLFIALFPNGRFSPPWARWYWYVLGIVGMLDLNTLEAIQPAFAVVVIIIFWLSFVIVGTMTQIYKYRVEAGPVERQQTKWVVAGFSGMAAFVAASITAISLSGLDSPIAFVGRHVFDLAALLLPLSIGVSILRYRLWDIDVIIRKTLQYALLTGLLALVYFGGIVVLQGFFDRLIGTANTPLVTVITTLGVSALFNPLRRQVQDFIDQRFYRKKYNAEKALIRFGAVTRSEVDLDIIVQSLLDVIEETVQPARSFLWVTRRDPTRRKGAL